MAIDTPLLPNEHVVFIPSGDSEGDLKARQARTNVQKKRTELAAKVVAIIEDTITAIIENASGTELDDEDRCSGSKVIDRYLARDPVVLQQALREGCFEQRGYTVFFFEVKSEERECRVVVEFGAGKRSPTQLRAELEEKWTKREQDKRQETPKTSRWERDHRSCATVFCLVLAAAAVGLLVAIAVWKFA
jgi:hypothetical protein